MKAHTLTILALLLFTTYGEIIYVTEFARHGARSPGEIYNFTVNPEDNFKEKNQLSPEGRKQHQAIGQDIRRKYQVPDTLLEIGRFYFICFE